MVRNFLVVTDLDGTLLDHHSYSWEAASGALAMLAAAEIPVVLCSSKTAAEMVIIRQQLGNDDPFIVENGAAIYIAGGKQESEDAEIVSFGMKREDFLGIIEQARVSEGVNFTGFNEMSASQLMAATGLDEASANYSLKREFTEPLLWQDSEERRLRFAETLRKAGLNTVQGGRFMHVSAGCDKGKAVRWLARHMAEKNGIKPTVIALGDSENDLPMLEYADYPVLVRSPVKDFPELTNPAAYRTEGFGPAGWNEAIKKILGD